MIRQETTDRILAVCAKNWPNRTLHRQELAFMMMKFLEEAGELSGAISTYFGRRFRPELASGDVENIAGEIGDILNIITNVCNLFGLSMDDCLQATSDKLERRYEREQERIAASQLPPFERIDN